MNPFPLRRLTFDQRDVRDDKNGSFGPRLMKTQIKKQTKNMTKHKFRIARLTSLLKLYKKNPAFGLLTNQSSWKTLSAKVSWNHQFSDFPDLVTLRQGGDRMERELSIADIFSFDFSLNAVFFQT